MAKMAMKGLAAARGWWCQFEALYLKCLETCFRRMGALCAIFVLPVVMVLVLAYMKGEAFEGIDDAEFPSLVELAPQDADGKPMLPECVIFNTYSKPTRLDCVNLAITWSTSEAQALAEGIAGNVACARETCYETFSSPTELAKQIWRQPGKFDASLIVDSAGSAGMAYTLWVNNSASDPYEREENDFYHFAKVQQAIETAALRFGVGAEPVKASDIKATLKKLPEVGYADVGNVMQTGLPDTVDLNGGTLVMFGLTMSAVFCLQLIASEKREGLLGLLRMTGLRESTYWLSWFLNFCIAYMITGFLVALVGSWTGVELFSECNLGVHMVAAFSYLTATCGLVLVFAAIVKEPWAVTLVQSVAVGFIMMWQTFVSQEWFRETGTPSDFWTARSQANPDFSLAEKIIVFFFPAFHYGKIMQNIYDVTGVEGGRSTLHALDGRLASEPVRHYNWSTMHEPVGYLFGPENADKMVGFPACFEKTPAYATGCKGLVQACTNATYQLASCPAAVSCNTLSNCDWVDFQGVRVGSWYGDSVGDSCGYLIADAIIFLIVAWYLAQVFSAGTGSAKPLYFPLLPSYWTGRASVGIDESEGAAAREKVLSLQEGSARLLKLSKSYAETTALKELSLVMHHGEVFCLLGHNGAGKTTTINLLTGLHPPTHGEAFVKGMSVQSEMSMIQAVMGVCPQDNVLFEGLSGASHLKFWGRFKGMARSALKGEAERLLGSVGLLAKASVPATSYSGGMKRRLSVAIASVAAPAIVFLDEPTTGLDPLSRMRTWESISKLKEERIVCLTTHSMEEAEMLGDKVGILAGGRLRALGTPLFLKGRFGSGYHITLLCDHDKSEDAVALLRESLPTADIISNVAGHITVGVPQRIFHLVPKFFSRLEESLAAGNKIVNEWSISASTLEEVFLKVAVQNHSVNADIEQIYGSADGVAGATHLTAGLVLNALEGMPVHMVVMNKDHQQIEIEDVTGVMCTSPETARAGKAAAQNPVQEVPADASSKGPQAAAEATPRVEASSGLTGPNGSPTWPAKVPSEEEAPKAEAAAAAVPAQSAPATNGIDPVVGAVVAPAGTSGAEPGQGAAAETTVAMGMVSFLAAPSDEEPKQPPRTSQIRGLILKSATLQRRQPAANCCRACCIVTLVVVAVVFNALMMMLMAGDGRAGRMCKAGFVIESTEFEHYAAEQQGIVVHEYASGDDEEGPDYTCREVDFVGFITDGRMCPEPASHAEVPDRDLNDAAEQVIYSVMDGSSDEEMPQNTQTCRRTYVNEQETSCDVEGGSLDKPCVPLVLADMCVTQGHQLKFLESGPWIAHVNEVPARKVRVAEELGTISIWHEGDFDMSWLGGFDEDKWVQSPNDAWRCGGRRVALSRKDSIVDSFVEAQKEQQQTAVQPQDLACSLMGEEGHWGAIFRLGINPLRQDETLPFKEGELDDLLKDFQKFPDLAMKLNSADAGAGSLDYEAWIYGVRARRDRMDPSKWNFADYPFVRTVFSQGNDDEKCSVIEQGATKPGTLSEIITSMSDGLLQKMWGAAGKSGEAPRIVSVVVPFPEMTFSAFGREWSAFIVLCFLPIVSMMFFPVITQTVQSECVEKNVMAMQIQSLRLLNYWIALYAWNSALYWVSIGVFYVANVAAGVTAFQQANHGLFFVVLVLWGHAQICMATFLSTLLGKSRLTSQLTYTIMIGTMIAGPMLALANFGKRWPTSLLLFPPLNFVRGSMLVLLKGVGEMSSDEEAEFGEICGLQIFVGTSLFIVGVVMHSYRQGTFSMKEYLANSGLGKFTGHKLVHDEAVVTPDEDVVAEEERVKKASPEERAKDSVRVSDLIKEYSSGYRAVRGVSFGIPTGECFGLLGPNGAGKTTVISMLSGSQRVSSGEASVGGYDVKKQMRRIHQVLGICPQFDIVWSDLPVIDHLLLFARIKGIAKAKERSFARQVAEAVGLDGDPLRMAAKNLSGGMRRRLSLAIALVANPKVVFLDEPSTGLDPETRQGLWRIIANITAGRCLVLTTHSMEEADALCSRIGIMALGTLRCLGTPMHLKNKFGQGYQLSISFKQQVGKNEAFLARIDGFIKEKLTQEATVVTSWKGDDLRTYSLPKTAIKVSKVFECITEQVKTDLGIQDWSLNQTSLNEVFLKIAAESER